MKALRETMRGIRVYRRSCFLLASLALSLAGGCAAKSEDANARPAPKTAEVTSEEAHHGRSFRVGALLPPGTEQANAPLRSAMQDAARTNNLILSFETAQAQQPSAPFARLRSQKIDALLVCARNDEDALTVTRPAREWEMPLVALVSEPPPEEENRKEEKKKRGKEETETKSLPGVVAEVAPRAPHIGTTTGERLSDALHGRGGVILITGKLDTLDAVSGAAWNDLRDYLHRHPALQVLETQTGPMVTADALKMLDRHGGKINALVCDDETALPFLAEICRQKKSVEIALFAFDAGHAALTMVQNFVEKPIAKFNPKPVGQSFQNAVVQKIGFVVPADAPGKLAVQTVAACLRGEKPRPRVWVEPVLVPIAAPSLFAPPALKSTPIVTPVSTMPGEKTP